MKTYDSQGHTGEEIMGKIDDEAFAILLTQDKQRELFEIMFNIALASEKDADRLRACEMLLDRKLGKPKSRTEHTGADGKALEMLIIHDDLKDNDDK